MRQHGGPGQGRQAPVVDERVCYDPVRQDRTPTRECPEIGRFIASAGFDPDAILGHAAAAEKRFHRPIALAILHRSWEAGLSLPETDDTRYKVGYGISVRIDGCTVRVGRKRYLEPEGIEGTPEVRDALDEVYREGYIMVMVGVDDRLGGAIEFQADAHPEVKSIIAGPRGRGIKHIAIISGDHDAPTRKLAESLVLL